MREGNLEQARAPDEGRLKLQRIGGVAVSKGFREDRVDVAYIPLLRLEQTSLAREELIGGVFLLVQAHEFAGFLRPPCASCNSDGQETRFGILGMNREILSELSLRLGKIPLFESPFRSGEVLLRPEVLNQEVRAENRDDCETEDRALAIEAPS